MSLGENQVSETWLSKFRPRNVFVKVRSQQNHARLHKKKTRVIMFYVLLHKHEQNSADKQRVHFEL